MDHRPGPCGQRGDTPPPALSEAHWGTGGPWCLPTAPLLTGPAAPQRALGWCWGVPTGHQGLGRHLGQRHRPHCVAFGPGQRPVLTPSPVTRTGTSPLHPDRRGQVRPSREQEPRGQQDRGVWEGRPEPPPSPAPSPGPPPGTVARRGGWEVSAFPGCPGAESPLEHVSNLPDIPSDNTAGAREVGSPRAVPTLGPRAQCAPHTELPQHLASPGAEGGPAPAGSSRHHVAANLGPRSHQTPPSPLEGPAPAHEAEPSRRVLRAA